MKNRLSKDICMHCKNATLDDMWFHVCSETHMEINLLDIACNNFKSKIVTRETKRWNIRIIERTW